MMAKLWCWLALAGLLVQMPAHARGGGGCFLPDTPILRTDGSSVAISKVRVGDQVRAYTTGGELANTTVREIYSVQADEYFIVQAGAITLRVTAEHPLYVGHGAFKTVATLRLNDTIYAADANGLQPRSIQSVQRIKKSVQVFNLRTDAPHTFFAAGIAAHNKGGGGFGGDGGGGGDGGLLDLLDLILCIVDLIEHLSDPDFDAKSEAVGALVVFLFVGMLVVAAMIDKKRKLSSKKENLDYLFSRRDIERKATKTMKLLEFLAKVDSQMAPEKLKEVAQTTFFNLQTCWKSRKYAPMKSLLMPDLYQDHLGQINGMVRNHEINKIEGLKVEAVDLVNVRYTHKPNDREFTALFSAIAKDYYVSDRTGDFLRGDKHKATFQEFWTFQFMDGKWLLREVEQTGESDILKDENFFEQFTDQGVKDLYAETAQQQGEAGPWLEKTVGTKAERTERLLNFLVQTDKLWNREAMLRRARQVFLNLRLAEEKGDPEGISVGDFFPDSAASLKEMLQSRKERVISIEYRNLCVRKVELLLVQNYADNSQDEFTVRVSAHAQRITMRSGYVLERQEYVTPFEEYLTFGRLEDQWKLKEIVPPAEGKKVVSLENVDEESSPEQLEWYYQQTRAVS